MSEISQRLKDHGYDSFLMVSFGGPEGPDDVMPFLDNVLAGKNVPLERKKQVAKHYERFGGVSPINGQVRDLIDCVEAEFARQGIDLPIYWGNRNWHPMLSDAVAEISKDSRKKTLAFVTSTFSSYSGCRQYREDIEEARDRAGDGAPIVEKLRVFFNNRLFVEAMADRVNEALDSIPEKGTPVRILFTAHSIPESMAAGCDYVAQLSESCQLVFDQVSHNTDRSLAWELNYQSRSGRPGQPWLEPDICDRIEQLDKSEVAEQLVLAPIGFLSDHMEVMFDLDVEAQELVESLGKDYVRAAAVGTHPKFVELIAELVKEKVGLAQPDLLGEMPLRNDFCSTTCCPKG